MTNTSRLLSDCQSREMKAAHLWSATCFVLVDDNKSLIIDYGRIVPQLFAWMAVKRSYKGGECEGDEKWNHWLKANEEKGKQKRKMTFSTDFVLCHRKTVNFRFCFFFNQGEIKHSDGRVKGTFTSAEQVQHTEIEGHRNMTRPIEPTLQSS